MPYRGGRGYSGLIWAYFKFGLLKKFSIYFPRANHYLILTFDLLTLQKIKIMRNDLFVSVRRTKLLLVLTRAEKPDERGYSGLQGAIQVYGGKIS